MPRKGKVKCACCEEYKNKDEMHAFDEKGKPVCDMCEGDDRSEPCATVIYGDYEEEPKTIGHYHDDTEGDFRVKYHSTDAWRGYYEVESDVYRKVHDDCILAFSEDEQNLKSFDDLLQEFCRNHDIRFARAFARTSNVFSYDFFVHKDDVGEVEAFMLLAKKLRELKEKYRDEQKFAMTALTGKDEHDDKDKLLVKAYKMMKAGKDGDEVIQTIMNEAVGQ